MKRRFLFCVLLLVVFGRVTAQQFAVVELFTSQGCSSCPSADRNLAAIIRQAEKDGKSIFGLSFHVDYWNYIGWKDPYSSKEFTERQKKYAHVLNLNSIYTPQMIVNGQYEFVGSDYTKATQVIESVLKEKRAYKINVTQVSLNETQLKLHYLIDKEPKGEVLNLAIVEKEAENYVSLGENRGKHLHHENVVRSLTVIPLKREDNILLSVPRMQSGKNSLIVYIQNNQFKIEGATLISLL